LKGTTKVVIPYEDEETRQYSMLVITETMYASKLYALIREFVKKNFGVVVDKDWLAHVPTISNTHDVDFRPSDAELEIFIEEFIQRVQCNEDEDSTDTSNEAKITSDAGEQVRIVPDKSSEGGI